MKNKLHFYQNWNGKLSFSKYFTTIRLHNPKKYQIGRVLEIYQNGKSKESAEIISIKTIRIEQINEFIAAIDTGYDVEKAKELIRSIYEEVKPSPDHAKYDFILLKWVTRSLNKELTYA